VDQTCSTDGKVRTRTTFWWKTLNHLHSVFFDQNFQQAQEVFPSFKMSETGSRPTHPPIQQVPRVNRSGAEVDPSPTSSAEVKNRLRCLTGCYTAFGMWWHAATHGWGS